MSRRSGATSTQREEPQGFPWKWVLWPLCSALCISGIVWSVMQLKDPDNLPLNTVRIDTPLVQVSQETIRNIVLPHADKGFIGLNVMEVRQTLEALPWVYQATVRRSWPDVLLISVKEQQAVARWASGGLLNPQGQQFDPGSGEDWSGLPLLRGPAGSEKIVMQEYRQMQQMLQPLGLLISNVTMDERRAWSLQVGGTLRLGLGRNDVERRLLRFVRVYPGVLEPRQAGIESVDLRYTNGFAIRWRDGYEPSPASA